MKPLTVLASRVTMVATASAVSFAAPAVASHNTHTYFDWYHGLGDGIDNDGSIHAFSDYYYNYMEADLVNISDGSEYNASGTGTHIHQSKTGLSRECKWLSGNFSQDVIIRFGRSGDLHAQYHYHTHHNYCP